METLMMFLRLEIGVQLGSLLLVAVHQMLVCLIIRATDYLFTATNKESGEHAEPSSGSFLLVTDSDLPAFLSEVEGHLTGAGLLGLTKVTSKRHPGEPAPPLARNAQFRRMVGKG